VLSAHVYTYLRGFSAFRTLAVDVNSMLLSDVYIKRKDQTPKLNVGGSRKRGQ